MLPLCATTTGVGQRFDFAIKSEFDIGLFNGILYALLTTAPYLARADCINNPRVEVAVWHGHLILPTVRLSDTFRSADRCAPIFSITAVESFIDKFAYFWFAFRVMPPVCSSDRYAGRGLVCLDLTHACPPISVSARLVSS